MRDERLVARRSRALPKVLQLRILLRTHWFDPLRVRGESVASSSLRFTASRMDLSSNSDSVVDPNRPSFPDEIVIHCSTVTPEVVTPFSANRIEAFSRLSMRMSHSGKLASESALSMCFLACSLVSMAYPRDQSVTSTLTRRNRAGE